MSKNKLKIPKSFDLMAQTVEVKFVDDLITNDDSQGMSRYRRMTLEIQKVSKSFPRTDDQVFQTFLHELVHWILFVMGEEDLRNKESFVELLSRLLHQVLKTARYKEEQP